MHLQLGKPNSQEIHTFFLNHYFSHFISKSVLQVADVLGFACIMLSKYRFSLCGAFFIFVSANGFCLTLVCIIMYLGEKNGKWSSAVLPYFELGVGVFSGVSYLGVSIAALIQGSNAFLAASVLSIMYVSIAISLLIITLLQVCGFSATVAYGYDAYLNYRILQGKTPVTSSV